MARRTSARRSQGSAHEHRRPADGLHPGGGAQPRCRRRADRARRRRKARSWSALPEYFCLMGRRDGDKLAVAEAPGDGPIQRLLSDAAREHGLWLVGGTLPLREPGETAACATRCLRVRARRQRWPRATTRCICSPSTTAASATTKAACSKPGGELVALQAGALRVGLSVCYDLRFPELYRTLMRPPCDLIVRARGLHLHHRAGALGTAAARARGREPVLCARAGAGRHARERPAHLGPQPDRRPLGRGAGDAGRRRGRGAWPRWTRSGWRRCARSCRRWGTDGSERRCAGPHGLAAHGAAPVSPDGRARAMFR